MTAADDRYTYPGSGGVLRNQLGLRTHAELDDAMNDYASLEWAALVKEPIPRELTFDYLREIHRRLLGDVVGDDHVGHWAGQVRSNAAPMGALNTGIAYAREEFINENLNTVFSDLRSKDYLRGMSSEEFFDELAESWGYLTQVHPFRDGNTRAQSAFIDRLSVNAGHPLQWSTIDVDTLRTMRLRAISRPEDLAGYLRSHELDDHDPSTVLEQSQTMIDRIVYVVLAQSGDDPIRGHGCSNYRGAHIKAQATEWSDEDEPQP